MQKPVLALRVQERQEVTRGEYSRSSAETALRTTATANACIPPGRGGQHGAFAIQQPPRGRGPHGPYFSTERQRLQGPAAQPSRFLLHQIGSKSQSQCARQELSQRQYFW